METQNRHVFLVFVYNIMTPSSLCHDYFTPSLVLRERNIKVSACQIEVVETALEVVILNLKALFVYL